jgi:hypothetical protein
MPDTVTTLRDLFDLRWNLNTGTNAWHLDYLHNLTEAEQTGIQNLLKQMGVDASFSDKHTLEFKNGADLLKNIGRARDILDMQWKETYSREQGKNVYRIDISKESPTEAAQISEILHSVGIESYKFSPTFGFGSFIDIPVDQNVSWMPEGKLINPRAIMRTALPVDPKASLDQSKKFNSEHRIDADEHILYGYRDGGRSVQFNADGTPANTPNREIIIVKSPDEDPLLKRAIDDAKQAMSSMRTTEEKARFLNGHVEKLMSTN